jgi:16S rRNA (adenine1518-N6/adenine1519-N6)-dimethyltransferase
MAAAHGSKTYGRLSVSLQSRCRVEHLFDVAPGAFRPPPKVDSAIVRIVPLDRPLLEPNEQDALDRLLRAAFAQRRKTLRNALRGLADDTVLEGCGIDPGVRAEDVPVARYVALARQAGSASAP